MKREKSLRRRLAGLRLLNDAVGALKSLASVHFQSARKTLTEARTYRAGVETLLPVLRPVGRPRTSAPPGLLLVASDIGLCGDYNIRLAAAAAEAASGAASNAAARNAAARNANAERPVVYCVGRRGRNALVRAGLEPRREYAMPTGVAGLTTLVLKLAGDLLDDYRAGRISGLQMISARFEGAGRFSPVRSDVLPPPASGADPPPISSYVDPGRLAVVVVREFVYIVLYQALLDALAAEHGMRLVAVESAGGWLDERIGQVRRELSAVRRERATQEVIEITAGYRVRRAASR